MPKSRAGGALEVDQATDHLRELIVEGRLHPGQRLVERRLAEHLGLSRVPVREALQHLVTEGFAAPRPTGGVVVRTHDDDEVRELLEISHALDAVAARRLLASEADLTPLRDVLDDAARAIADGRVADAVAANSRFHEVLLETAPAPMVRETVAPLRRVLRWLLRRHSDPQVVHDEHVAIVDAVARGDGDLLESLLVTQARTSLDALAGSR